MWKWIKWLFLAGMVLFWAIPAFCEYYQYTDQNGVLRFTDDLTNVPPDQRPDVITHRSVESQSVKKRPGATAAERASRSAAAPEPGTQPAGGTWQKRHAQQRQALSHMQAELKKTFETLQTEREALEANAPPDGALAEETGAYAKKVAALNARIGSYEEELDAYNQAVNAFNARVNN